MKVGIIDYGIGNLGSVFRAVEELNFKPRMIERAVDLHNSDCIILPGVGNFGDCIKLLQAGGWIDEIRDSVINFERPLLGICLGMQLLADSSTEGLDDDGNPPCGLGLIAGQVQHLRVLGTSLRVPHVGWNSVKISAIRDTLFHEIPDETDFYFVHSYAFVVENSQDVIAVVDYGVEITAAVRHGRVWGTQFHPEKSSKRGLQLLRNFLEAPHC
jgi:glutamine amidotransferase